MRRTLALSRQDLLARLDRIEVEGWDGLTGTELLEYVRTNMVRIQVISAGLTGPAGEQAEVTGWAIAWETLRSAGLRSAVWPWSVLWVAVRRAVRGSGAAGAYLTNPRNAWDLRRTTARYWRMPPPLSFDRLVEDGYESATHLLGPVQPVLGEVVELLVDVGWAPELAARSSCAWPIGPSRARAPRSPGGVKSPPSSICRRGGSAAWPSSCTPSPAAPRQAAAAPAPRITAVPTCMRALTPPSTAGRARSRT